MKCSSSLTGLCLKLLYRLLLFVEHLFACNSALRHLRSSSTLATLKRSSRSTRSCIKVRNLLLAESDLDDEVVGVTEVGKSVVPVMVEVPGTSQKSLDGSGWLRFLGSSSFLHHNGHLDASTAVVRATFQTTSTAGEAYTILFVKVGSIMITPTSSMLSLEQPPEPFLCLWLESPLPRTSSGLKLTHKALICYPRQYAYPQIHQSFVPLPS